MTLAPDLSVSVAHWHTKEGFPDHRIAAKLRIPVAKVARIRTRLGLAPHPPNSRLTVAQVHQHVAQWERYIYSLVNGFHRNRPHLDIAELIQEGFAGAMRAGEKYDPNRINEETGRPLKFSTYAKAWVLNFLQKHASRANRKGFSGSTGIPRGVRSLERMFGGEGGEESSWEPADESDSDSFFREQRNRPEWWDNALGSLSESERKVVYYRFRYGWNHAMIGSMLGKTYGIRSTKVGDVLQEALGKLKERGEIE